MRPHRTRHIGSSVVLLSTLALTACGSSATTVTSPTSLTRCAVTLAGTGSTVPAQGGGGMVNVSAARECSWTASSDAAWLSIKAGATGQGDGAVEFAAAVNPDPAARRGAIILNDQRVDVTQAAGECAFTLAERSSSFPPEGGSGRIEVQASSSLCSWTAATGASWVTLRSDPNGKGSAPVAFDVAATTGPPRSGLITVAGHRFEVIQSQGCTYAISPETHATAASGAAGNITVTTTPGCPWSAASSADWLTLSPGEGAGPGLVSFSVAPTTGAARAGSAVIAGRTFTVNQHANCSFVVDPPSHSVGAAGGIISVSVGTASDCSWNAASGASWIKLDGASTSAGQAAVTFVVDANTEGARTGTVTVAGRVVTVTQTAAAPAPPTCTLGISPESATVPATGQAGQITVNVAVGCPWTATSNAPWIQISSPGSGNGPSQVSYSVAPSTDVRTGTITIGSKTFTVTQAAAACSYALSASGASLPAAGGNGTVNVATSGTCGWTATSNAEWLAISAGGTGAGSGTISFAAAPSSGAERTGTLLIAGQTFTVTQAAAAECRYKVKPDEIEVDWKTRTRSVDVETGSECAWTATSNVEWIRVTGGEAGSGGGEVSLLIYQNDGKERKGTVTIAGQPVTVTQDDQD